MSGHVNHDNDMKRVSVISVFCEPSASKYTEITQRVS